MATASIYVNPKLYNKDGKLSICIEVIHERRNKRKTIMKIDPREWDFTKIKVKPTNPDHVAINARLYTTLSQVQTAIQELEAGSDINLKELIEGYSYDVPTKFMHYYSIFKEKNLITSGVAYNDRVSSLEKKFLKDYPDIMCHQLNAEWFRSFVAKQAFQRSGEYVPVKPATAKNYLKMIRAVLAIARKNKISINEELFDLSIPVAKTIKRKLTLQQINQIEKLPLQPGSMIEKVRDFFMMQIYLRGMRVGDLLTLKQEDLNHDTVAIEQRKTGGALSISLLEITKPIIDKYKGKSSNRYVFPFLSIPDSSDRRALHYDIKRKTAVINKYLGIIADMIEYPHKLSSHIARHSFALLLLKDNISLDVISKLLGHRNVKITVDYLDELMEDEVLELAASKVLSKIGAKQ